LSAKDVEVAVRYRIARVPIWAWLYPLYVLAAREYVAYANARYIPVFSAATVVSGLAVIAARH
jgi:hypothetical protein